ncbi:hypothetical protein KVR01_008711 [Diaporthe batatas]|uniref:uncharacterized protein n=1 Tax=Diaporthe batatas TaxID=748121 RepID=UPI001D05BD61|nr:uncharacterized protein KVR01_008711 [Diaporthe batatas]KAG8161724.1 hypothetical protein KVR01_008711 [Diaporthe batatas]
MGRGFLKGLLPPKSKPLDISNPMVSPSLGAKLTRKQLDEYVPKPQPYYIFSGSRWQRVNPPATGPVPGPGADDKAGITNLRLLTWNIDFMAPFPQARMAAALAYLQTVVEGVPEPSTTAVVICLQELRQDMPIDLDRPVSAGRFDPQIADDLRQVAAAAWVQGRFLVSDLATDHWRCGYNCVTLVDRRLGCAGASRLPFVSEYRREALLVDIPVAPRAASPSPSSPSSSSSPGEKQQQQTVGSVLRICNVHLDSMAGKPPMRPIQWKACAKYLQRASDGVAGGILAGDCNANQGYDLTQAEENGFTDAYLETGGEEGDPRGHTWGPQSKSSRFPHKRMDKVCFCQPGRGGGDGQQLLNLKSLEKIGVGVKIGDESISAKLAEEGWLDFVTDHYGLMADFEIGEAWILGVEA